MRKITSWADKQRFMGDWMPRAFDFSEIFLGEYPWLSAYRNQYKEAYGASGWTRGDSWQGEKLPAPVIVSNEDYVGSYSYDCSTEEALGVTLPSLFLIEKMKLCQPTIDGRYYDKKEDLIFCDPGVFGFDPHVLLANKKKIIEFLNKEGLFIFWTIIGERQLFGGDVGSNGVGHLEINGCYFMNGRGKIDGKLRTKFIEHFSK